MADDLVTVAVGQHSLTPAADAGHSPYLSAPSATAADRVERGIEILSRWAGIATFIGAVCGIGYLIF